VTALRGVLFLGYTIGQPNVKAVTGFSLPRSPVLEELPCRTREYPPYLGRIDFIVLSAQNDKCTVPQGKK